MHLTLNLKSAHVIFALQVTTHSRVLSHAELLEATKPLGMHTEMIFLHQFDTEIDFSNKVRYICNYLTYYFPSVQSLHDSMNKIYCYYTIVLYLVFSKLHIISRFIWHCLDAAMINVLFKIKKAMIW